jgi:hypothetical protein
MAGIGANEPFTSLIKNGSICPKPDLHNQPEEFLTAGFLPGTATTRPAAYPTTIFMPKRVMARTYAAC